MCIEHFPFSFKKLVFLYLLLHLVLEKEGILIDASEKRELIQIENENDAGRILFPMEKISTNRWHQERYNDDDRLKWHLCPIVSEKVVCGKRSMSHPVVYLFVLTTRIVDVELSFNSKWFKIVSMPRVQIWVRTIWKSHAMPPMLLAGQSSVVLLCLLLLDLLLSSLANLRRSIVPFNIRFIR